jgi:hypothetical protein
MSEVLSRVPYSMDEYQRQVELTRRDDFGDDWKDKYADLIQDEILAARPFPLLSDAH